MADTLEARREARRRKLTQNAEARMNRLLGNRFGDSNNVSSSSLQSCQSDPDSQTDHAENSAGTPSPYNLRNRSKVSPSTETLGDSHQETNSQLRNTTDGGEKSAQSTSSESSLGNDKQHIASTGQILDGSVANSVGFSHAAASRSPPNPMIGQQNTTGPADPRSFEMIKLMGCVLTALLTSYSLALGYSLFYFENIVFPFCVFELSMSFLTHFHFKHQSLPPSRSTIWSAALMLCGIKHELIEKYNIIMSFFANALSDFCFYMFAFIVMNALLG